MAASQKKPGRPRKAPSRSPSAGPSGVVKKSKNNRVTRSVSRQVSEEASRSAEEVESQTVLTTIEEETPTETVTTKKKVTSTTKKPTIKQVQKIVDEQQSSIEELQTTNTQLQTTNSQLESTNTDLTTANSQHDVITQQLEETIESSQRTIEEQQEALQQKEQAIQKSDETTQGLETRIKQLEADLHQREQDIKDQAAIIEDREQQVRDREATIGDRDTTINTQKNTIKQFETIATESGQQIRFLEENVRDLKGFEQQVENQAAFIKEYKQQIEEQSTTIFECEQKIEKQSIIIKSQEKTAVEQEEAITASNKEIEELKDASGHWSIRAKRAEGDVGRAQHLANMARDQHLGLKRQIADRDAKIARLEKGNDERSRGSPQVQEPKQQMQHRSLSNQSADSEPTYSADTHLNEHQQAATTMDQTPASAPRQGILASTVGRVGGLFWKRQPAPAPALPTAPHTAPVQRTTAAPQANTPTITQPQMQQNVIEPDTPESPSARRSSVLPTQLNDENDVDMNDYQGSSPILPEDSFAPPTPTPNRFPSRPTRIMRTVRLERQRAREQAAEEQRKKDNQQAMIGEQDLVFGQLKESFRATRRAKEAAQRAQEEARQQEEAAIAEEQRIADEQVAGDKRKRRSGHPSPGTFCVPEYSSSEEEDEQPTPEASRARNDINDDDDDYSPIPEKGPFGRPGKRMKFEDQQRRPGRIINRRYIPSTMPDSMFNGSPQRRSVPGQGPGHWSHINPNFWVPHVTEEPDSDTEQSTGTPSVLAEYPSLHYQFRCAFDDPWYYNNQVIHDIVIKGREEGRYVSGGEHPLSTSRTKRRGQYGYVDEERRIQKEAEATRQKASEEAATKARAEADELARDVGAETARTEAEELAQDVGAETAPTESEQSAPTVAEPATPAPQTPSAVDRARERAREEAEKYKPKTPSRLREASRLSSSPAAAPPMAPPAGTGSSEEDDKYAGFRWLIDLQKPVETPEGWEDPGPMPWDEDPDYFFQFVPDRSVVLPEVRARLGWD